MKKILLATFVLCLGFAGCSKDEGNRDVSNVQKAINAITDKNTATSLVVTGDLNDADWNTLKDIKRQLRFINSITLSDAKVIKKDVFIRRNGQTLYTNLWLTSFSAPKATEIENAAFMFCDALEVLNIPSVTIIGKESFLECIAIESIDLPKVVKIGEQAFAACSDLKSIKFGATSAIEVPVNAFQALDTKNISIDVVGIEASNVVGKIWKDHYWKTITSNNVPLPVADFGIAYFGTSRDFVLRNETKTVVPGGGSNRLIFSDRSNNWYTYNFDDDQKLTSGMIDHSMQFGSTPTDLVFLPILDYITELDELKAKFGEPSSANKNVFSFILNEKTMQPGYAWYEAQAIMNGGTPIVYEFSNSTMQVKTTLRSYARTGKTQPWGFTIETTYSPK